MKTRRVTLDKVSKTTSTSESKPDWWDPDKLVKIYYNRDIPETGWAVDLGDGTYRLANTPITSAFDLHGPKWGDRVVLTQRGIEKYE